MPALPHAAPLAGLIFLAALAPAAAQGGAAPSWQPGMAGILAFETSPFLRAFTYRSPDMIGHKLAPSGAYGPLNIGWESGTKPYWDIEIQKYGYVVVAAGVANGRQDVIERGEKILDWGFQHENPDGSFNSPDVFHSAAFFVEAATHAALLLQASPYARQNAAWIGQAKQKLRLTITWMMQPAVEARGRKNDLPYTHRYYLDGAAIGETGVLLGDAGLVRHSRDYILQGLAQQRPDGVNPERGGSDTNYQGVGLAFAERYYTVVADDGLRAQMRPMMDRGLGWLASMVQADGEVDQSANTRTGLGQERSPQGVLKKMDYAGAARTSYFWFMVTGQPRWMTLARQLQQGGKAAKADEAQAGAEQGA